MISPYFVATPWDDYINLFGNPATIYDTAANSIVTTTKVAFSNVRSLLMLGSGRSDLTEAQFLSGAPLSPGTIVQIPSAPVEWFAVIKTLNKSDPGIVKSAMLTSLFPLPMSVSITDEGDVPFETLSPYGEPVARNSNGELVIPTETVITVHAGLSNDFDALGNIITGDMPDFIETVVIPLGTPIKKAQTVHLPDGRYATVNQTNFLHAEGYPYALQLVLAGSADPGTAPA